MGLEGGEEVKSDVALGLLFLFLGSGEGEGGLGVVRDLLLGVETVVLRCKSLKAS